VREEGFFERLDIARDRLQLGLDAKQERTPALAAQPFRLRTGPFLQR
jgi:hypothetical protein